VFKLGAFLQIVQIHNIRVVVLGVVKLKRFFGVMGCQRIDGKRQTGEMVFHGVKVPSKKWPTTRESGSL
jgi:hypothetical protein